MGFVGIAPGRAAVDENLELTGHVRPVGWGNGNNDVRPFKLLHQKIGIVPQYAPGGGVAGPAAPAESDAVVVDAYGFRIVPDGQFFAYDTYDLRCRAVAHGAAVDDQRFHTGTPPETPSRQFGRGSGRTDSRENVRPSDGQGKKSRRNCVRCPRHIPRLRQEEL